MGESSLLALYNELLAAERDLCKRDLASHIEIACGKLFDPVVHGDIIAAYQKKHDSGVGADWYELICMLARGHQKSTLFACIYTWEVATDRDTTGAIVGAVHATGSDTVFLIRQLLESASMVEIYGSFRGESVWNNEELIVSGRSDAVRESTVKAMGIEGFKPGIHVKILWFDDPEDQDTTSTPDQLAKGRRIYALGRPMADKPDSMRWLTGTFWADNDLYCHLIEKFGLGKVDEQSGRLLCENNTRSKSGKQLLFYKPAEDEAGNPLFPSRFPKETLREIRDEMEFTSPGSYDKQYLLNPVTNKSARFRSEDYQSASSAPLDGSEVWFGMDLAQSKTEGSDRSGIVGFFATHDYAFYVFEASEIKLDADAQQNAIFERQMAFPKARFAIEADNFVKGWIPQFNVRCREAGIFPLIDWIDSGARAKKDDRIFGTEGLFRAKRVYFLPGTSILWSQLSRMPASKRKDVADAWANPIPFIIPQLGAYRGVQPEKKVYGWEKLLNNANQAPPWQENGRTPDQPYAGVPGDQVPWPAS